MADLAEFEPKQVAQTCTERLNRIREYHSPRRLDGDGFTMIWCRECRQNWPCPTSEAVDGKW